MSNAEKILRSILTFLTDSTRNMGAEWTEEIVKNYDNNKSY
jgi:hypothetical protein